MLLPHSVYVILILGLSAIAAGFVVYVLLKAVPRNADASRGLRGCVGLIAFLFILPALMGALMWALPHSIVISAGPGNTHHREEALFTCPAAIKSRYNPADFDLGKTHIINRSDSDMAIYRANPDEDALKAAVMTPTIVIPANSCTAIEPEYLPDYYFERPDISPQDMNASSRPRWVLDYMPTNH